VGALIAVGVGAGLRGFLIAWLVAALAEWISMWILGLILARRHLAGHRLIGSARGAVEENPGIRWFMIAANADVTFGDLAQRLASLAVGWVLGPASAGIYAVALRATSIVTQPAGNLGQASYAELSRLIAAGGSGADIRAAFGRAVTIALLLAAPLVLAATLFGRPIARLMAGPQFAEAGDVMPWLFVARAILLAAPPASAGLVALGLPGASFRANLVTSLGMLPLLPLLMMYFSLEGAGQYAVLQGLCTSVMLGAVLWRHTRDPTSRS
jgi:O-antigen/teichoic acid export membrane protein